jgi:hypothetical protein
VDVALDRRVLGGEAEGVEADREHHVGALHALEAGARIGRRHRVPVADVEIARRIGEHGQAVHLPAGGVDRRLVQAVVGPTLLPPRLDLLRSVPVARLVAFAFRLRCHVSDVLVGMEKDGLAPPGPAVGGADSEPIVLRALGVHSIAEVFVATAPTHRPSWTYEL